MTPVDHLVALASQRRAVLFACRKGSTGELSLDHVATLENPHESEHERGRPTFLGGAERRGTPARSSAHAAPHAVAATHAAEEEERRFARDVWAWIAAESRQRGAPAKGSVSLFAEPRLLGVLRATGGDAAGTVDLREGDFAHMNAVELASHAAIRSVLLR